MVAARLFPDEDGPVSRAAWQGPARAVGGSTRESGAATGRCTGHPPRRNFAGDPGGRGADGASAWRVNGYGGGMANTTRIQPDQVRTPGGNGRLMHFTTPA